MKRILGLVAFLVFCESCSQSSEAPIEAKLTALAPSYGTLVPAFDEKVEAYALAVSFRTSSLTFDVGVPAGVGLTVDGAAVSAPFSQSLSVGETVLAIGATAGGVTRTYRVTVTRHRQYAYVTNVNTSGTDSLSLFSIEPQTGALQALATPSVAAGNDPYDLGVSPDGRNLYVANAQSNTLSLFSIDFTSGLLTSLTPATVSQSPTPYGTLVHPSGNFLYSVNGDSSGPGIINQYARDTASGGISALTPATVSTGNNPWFVALHPNGRYLYATLFGSFGDGANDSVAQFAIDQSSGALSALSPATVASQDKPWSVVVHPNGNSLYLVNYGSGTISQYAIGANGTLSALVPATLATGTQPVGIGMHPAGTFLYVGNSGSNTVSQFSISPTTGALTSLGTATAGSNPYGLAVDSTGSFVYVCNSGASTVSQFRIGSDGTLTPMSPATVAAGTNPRFVSFSY